MVPRSSARPVGVDVTSHKEERDLTNARKRTKLRVRYYVELVVGSARERHVRLGFSGNFKTLMALHDTFLRAYLDKYSSSKHALAAATRTTTSSRASLSSSTSSSTSRSSLSSSSPRGVKKLVHTIRLKKHIPSEPHGVNHVRGNNQSDADIALPFLPPFPVASKLLVHLEKSTGEAKDDAKIAARTSALFGYYTQLFNSEEGELFLEIVQLRSIEQAEQSAIDSHKNNNNEPHVQDASQPSRGGGLFKFLARHSLTKSASNSSEDMTKRLEFSAPVQVSSSGKARPLKHAKPRSKSVASRF